MIKLIVQSKLFVFLDKGEIITYLSKHHKGTFFSAKFNCDVTKSESCGFNVISRIDVNTQESKTADRHVTFKSQSN